MRARLAVTSASTILSNPRAIRCSSSRTAATTATSPPQQAEAGKPHAHLRQYLDAWMGSTGTLNTTRSTTTGPVASHQHHHPHPSSAGHPITLTVAGKSYLVPTLRLPRGVGPLDLQAGLKATTSLSAGYFKCAPIVVDLGEWMTSQPLPRGGVRTEAAGKGGEVLDAVLLGEFVETLREAGLQPVGIANATATDIQAAAMALGLPCFMGRHGGNGINSSNSPGSAAAPANAAAPAAAMTPSTARPARKPTMAAAHLPSTSPRSEAPKPSTSPTSPNAATISSQPLSPPSPSAAPILPTKVIQGSVRTGQQVVAEGASLVILGHVNSGAEVSADGDIHIYGRLSGRALAGLGGDGKSKIFAGKFNAELVAIADVFTTCDFGEEMEEGREGVVLGAPTSVSLNERGGSLVFHSFKV
ncbi:septum site-determining protein [Nannochloropsis oceanica]